MSSSRRARLASIALILGISCLTSCSANSPALTAQTEQTASASQTPIARSQPSQTAAPEVVTFPAPDEPVSGGGPGEVSVGEQHIDYFLAPKTAGGYSVEGPTALTWGGSLIRFAPEARTELTAIATAGQCAISQGVADARGYITSDLHVAGIELVVSKSQATHPLQVAAACLEQELKDVTGGGPSTSTSLTPCADRFYINASFNGIPDTYYIIDVGTNPIMCAYIRHWTSNFPQHDFD